jgi:hypothetical protein
VALNADVVLPIPGREIKPILPVDDEVVVKVSQEPPLGGPL